MGERNGKETVTGPRNAWQSLTLAAPLPPALRFRLLKHTRLNVVAFLNELPKTQHDVNSFVVDISAQTVSTDFLPDSRNGEGAAQRPGSGWAWGLCGSCCCFSFRTRCCAFL